MRTFLRSVTVFLACIATVTCAAAGVGTTAAQFLKINPSARSAGMAGVTAGADDAYAPYANPAGIARLDAPRFGATYLRYFADVNYGYVGYAAPAGVRGAFGLGYTYLLVPDIEKRDTSETRLGTFNAQDTAVSVAYAHRDALGAVIEDADIGAAVKLISSQIDQTIAYAAALDLSATMHPGEGVAATLAVQNISPGIRFREVTDPLPLNLKFAASWQALPALRLGGDIDEYLTDNKWYAAAGAEYWPVRQIAVRGGYRFGYHTESLGSLVGLRLGFGVRLWNVGLDYAFVPFGDLGDTHRVSFVAKF